MSPLSPRGTLCCISSCLLILATLSPLFGEERPWRINTIAGSGNAELQGKAELGPFDVLATDVNLNQTFGVEVDQMGNLYICEVGHHRLWQLDLRSGKMRSIAGTGKPGDEGDGGLAPKATLNEPYEVRLDSQGNIYLVEMVGAVVRRIDGHSGAISTVAGTGVPGFSGDGGLAVAAQLRQPHSIALDDQGGLYIADIGNHRIRKVDLTTGLIETIAGTGERKLPESGKLAKGQPISGPRALHIKGDFMWIALREGNSIWRLNLRTGILDHIAGSGKKGFRDGTGSQALFNGPKGIVAGTRNDLFVVDTENQVIRRIDLSTREVSTIAGVGPHGQGFSGDSGPALRGMMDRPHGIACGPRGLLYIGDTNNHRVRMLTPPWLP